MLLSMEARTPCTLCGYRLAYVYIATTERINKRSLRVRGGLGACAYWRCPECGTRTDVSPAIPYARFRLTPESAEAIRIYRLKRWPELATEGLVA